MKILIYAPVLGRGGCRRVAEKLSEAWSIIGNDVDFLGSPYDEHGHELSFHHNVQEIQLRGGAHPYYPELWRWLQENYTNHYMHLLDISENYDMIFAPMPWHTMRVPNWEIKTPFIAFLPDFAHDYLDGLVSDELKIKARREAFNFAKYAHTIVFSSSFQKAWGEKYYGMEHTKLIRKPGFIPNNFDCSYENIRKVCEKYSLPSEYMLSFHPYGHKDPLTLLRGYAQAKLTHEHLPPLVLAGIHSELLDPFNKSVSRRDHLAKQVHALLLGSNLNIERDLRFLGYIPDEDMGGLYAGSLAVITASKSEGGVPGTLCEAAASNTPIIYSNIPAHVEVLGEQDENGYSFQMGNASDLSLTICRAFNNYLKFMSTTKNLSELLNRDNWIDIGFDYMNLVKET